MSENMVDNLIKERYCISNEISFDDVCKRVSKYIASDENYENAYYNMMIKKDFLPNSPTLMNAGTATPMLSACFFLPISDCISNNKDGIFDQVRNAALVFKFGGGVGLNFSNLRPAGSKVKSTNGVSSGVISFMKNFNTMTETIKQGGKRRGALMGCLDITHPEIEDFLTCKNIEGDLSNFNISVKLTDEFLNNPDPILLNLIIDGIYKNGEPGILFKDTIERLNPRPDLGELNPNPCLHKNTYMFTQNGLEKISNIRSKLFDGEKFISCTTQKTGLKNTIKITTISGYEYITTPDHMFMLNDDNWCEAINLYGKNIKFDILEREWVGINPYPSINYEVLGFEFGDGSYHKASKRVKYIYLTIGKDDEVKHMIEREFNTNVVHQRNRYHIIVPLNSPYASLFTDKIENRLIPDWIMQLPKEQMRKFIRGLFSANGCNLQKYNKIQLVSINKEMLTQLQQMLSLFGIKAKLWVHNKQCDIQFTNGIYTSKISYHLVLSRDSYLKYLNTIGFIQSYKNKYNSPTYIDKKYNLEREEKVISIENYDQSEVWDFVSPDTHYGITNGAIVHNCAEALLYNFESCNLGSINWSNMLKQEMTSNNWKDNIDWSIYEYTIRKAVHFLNNVIDKNHYPLDEIDKASKLTRKIGLGGMGFHDMLLKLYIPYESDEALEIAKEIEQFMRKIAKDQSEKYQFNNTSLTTIAPTGTISIIAGVSSGIEPVFNWVITRKDSLGEHYVVHPIFLQELIKEVDKYDYTVPPIVDGKICHTPEELEGAVIKHCHIRGTIQDLPLTFEFLDLFKNAMDINWKHHIKMQSTFQNNGVDMSISKTINLPNNATKDNIRDAIFMAWKSGCKGLTIYRSGSRENEVLNLKKETIESLKIDLDQKISEYKENMYKRPRFLYGITYKVQSGCGKLYVTINERNGKPYEVFIQSDGSGGCEAGNQALGRTISVALRNGGDIYSIIKQLCKVKCPAAQKNSKSEGKSCSDIVGKLIKESIPDECEEISTEPTHEKCPECGKFTLVRESGCKICHSCGYNKCG